MKTFLILFISFTMLTIPNPEVSGQGGPAELPPCPDFSKLTDSDFKFALVMKELMFDANGEFIFEIGPRTGRPYPAVKSPPQNVAFVEQMNWDPQTGTLRVAVKFNQTDQGIILILDSLEIFVMLFADAVARKQIDGGANCCSGAAIPQEANQSTNFNKEKYTNLLKCLGYWYEKWKTDPKRKADAEKLKKAILKILSEKIEAIDKAIAEGAGKFIHSPPGSPGTITDELAKQKAMLEFTKKHLEEKDEIKTQGN